MDIDAWIEECLPKHVRLTESILSIAKSLLETRGVEYLSISGRTKDANSIHEKVKRKKYKDPQSQVTDISGIRIIVFIESEIQNVSDIINQSFNVDMKNSSNKDDGLSSDQVGYRSVHFVCDLGPKRAELPEFEGLCDLKFEFQIRTVLQHAWAELAHDRSYKFRSVLPKDIQRRLYLHAGLLEIADKGFSDISREIDAYTAEVIEDYRIGNLDLEINSITLRNFIEDWARSNDYPLETIKDETHFQNLIDELKAFGATKIADIIKIIPENYAKKSKELAYYTNIYGLIRGWLIIKDIKKLKEEIRVNWTLYDPDSSEEEYEIYKYFSTPENYDAILTYAEAEKYDMEDDEEHNF
ncbi:GTP pyrophosphokinase [Neorhizobium alkalisoli]|uniref:GTP pyrophosphokinase n=1 Tax=Neorhizobium alkalisoli TaxID=528178 RepID=UPI000CF94C72|nr:GTP pyrophosphokinase [Neorhizobium alkalisoli]